MSALYAPPPGGAYIPSSRTPSAIAAKRLNLGKYLANEAPLEVLGKLHDRVDVDKAIKVGSGSLGVVLAAPDKLTGGSLAVKVISLKRAREVGEGEARIRQEVRAMHVEHPNLVRLSDVLACWSPLPHIASEAPYLCICMDYVGDAEPLSNTLRRNGGSLALAVRVVPQITSALAALHENGIVHRDVWSENVLVDKNGKAVLVDMGCAEFLHGDSVFNSMLNIPYMSPEAVKGCRQSTADDCWSLGVLMTEMITGKFIRERMGRSDVPLHFDATKLTEAKYDTAAMGGQLMGRIAIQLLDLEAERRPSMAGIVCRCSFNPQLVTDSSGFPVAPSMSVPISAPHHAPVLVSGASLVGSRPTAPEGVGWISPGQPCVYMPRSHNVPRHAVVVGRVPGRPAWHVQLTNGALKEVDDTELWRLSRPTAVDSGFAPNGGLPLGQLQFQTQTLAVPIQTQTMGVPIVSMQKVQYHH